MKWEDREQSSNVDDRRSAKSGGGGGASIGTLFRLWPLIRPLTKSKWGWAIIVIGGLFWILGFNPLSFMGGDRSRNTVIDKKADNRQAAFIKTVLADTEKVWSSTYASQGGGRYKKPVLVLYRGSTRSACGGAKSQMGPFYCPADQKVYLDLAFFDELKSRHKAAGDFAQAYVLAHEIAHHVQNMQGTLRKVQRAKQQALGKTQANKLQVKVELQADCLAGVWANQAQSRFNMLEPGDINEALRAASSIGDDTLQRQSTGRVVPDAFTHGSSKQRVEWFSRGFKTGLMSQCNTFK